MKQLFFVTLICLTTSAIYAETPSMPTDWVWVETPAGKPVIDRGAPGCWDHYAVDNPYVHVEDGRYYCFFDARQNIWKAGGHERFGLAISDDGIHWKKLPKPLLDVGPEGSWESAVAKLPAGVTKRDGKYFSFYSGRGTGTKQIGLAMADQITGPWKKHEKNPVIPSREDHWDRSISCYPTPLFYVDGKYHLLFRGMKKCYQEEGIGAAVSSDLVHWDRVSEIEEKSLTDVKEEIASFAVAQVNDKFIGISQTLNPKEYRRYWYSKDLLHWDKGPKAEFQASGNVSTLSNPFLVDGKWNVVYEQDDRIYRAVLMPPEEATARLAKKTNK